MESVRRPEAGALPLFDEFKIASELDCIGGHAGPSQGLESATLVRTPTSP
jgi:hypothetical protein